MITGGLTASLRSDRKLKVEALRNLAGLPKDGEQESLRALALPFLADPDPWVREAAVWASPAACEWRTLLAREADPIVRRACVFQLATLEQEQAIPDLIQFLHSEDWQLRSVSAEALVKLGVIAVDQIKPLVHHSNRNVRISALRILLDLKQDSWLKRELSAFHEPDYWTLPAEFSSDTLENTPVSDLSGKCEQNPMPT